MLPLPPIELAARVGGTHADNYRRYEEVGMLMRRDLLAALPESFDLIGKRVLDFGCGAGRTLRHFVEDAERATFYGCDIDRASIEWLGSVASPPFAVFLVDDRPPLPLPSRSLDLVWAVSVFSHLTEEWAAWLAELHRVLDDGGILLVTFIAQGAAASVTDEPWDEERTGMTVLYHQSWDLGGPMVLHSRWWIEEHWGRAFDIFDFRPSGFVSQRAEDGQGLVAMRKRETPVDAAMLSRIDPNQPREIPALLRQIELLSRELGEVRRALDDLRGG